MPFLTRVCRALPAVTLFLTLASATQSCWYPDGTTLSSDVPCNSTSGTSACCSSQSFCLVGGGCFTGGVVTRGSCTDVTWTSPECAEFCLTSDTDAEIPITPCAAGVSTNSFVCGLDNGDCNDSSKTFTLASDTSFILRPAQIELLVSEALASGAASSADSGDTTTLIGVAVGIAVPLLIALAIVSYFLVREKRRASRRRSMYKFPDSETKESLTIHARPSILNGLGLNGVGGTTTQSSRRSSFISDRGSFRTVGSTRPAATPIQVYGSRELQKPAAIHKSMHSFADSERSSPRRMHSYTASERGSHIPSFAERIEGMKVTPQLVDVRDSNSSRHELDSGPSSPRPLTPRSPSQRWAAASPGEVERYELATSRMSR